MRRELFALISLGLLASSVVAQIARAFDSDGMREVMPLSFEKRSTCGRGKGPAAHVRAADELSDSRFLGRSQLRSGCKLPRRLGNVGCDRIHQGR
jgi:hypothetical protein